MNISQNVSLRTLYSSLHLWLYMMWWRKWVMTWTDLNDRACLPLLIFDPSLFKAFFTSSKPRVPPLSESDGAVTPYAQGHTGGLTGLSLPRAEPSVGSPHVSLFVSGADRGDTNCTPVSQRGICFDMAILDSAYLLSQVIWVFALHHKLVIQITNWWCTKHRSNM